MCLIFYPFLILICFFTFPFLTIFYFYIIKKSHFKNFSRPSSLGKAAVDSYSGKLGRDTEYLEVYRGFPHSLWLNSGVLSLLGYSRFHSINHLSTYAL
jgi:hypothetical protein